MNKPQSPYIIVGKIGSSYGVHGWLKIISYTQFEPSILDYQPWYIDGSDTILNVVDSEVQANNLLVKLDGVDSPEAARLYAGKNIAALRTSLPELQKNEFYWSDLQGMTVINKDGTVFGTVNYLIETGSNDVLVVKGDKEIAIPYLPEVVLHVDLEKREIQVDWEPL